MRNYKAHSSNSKFLISYNINDKTFVISKAFSVEFPFEEKVYTSEAFYDELLNMGRLSTSFLIKFQKGIETLESKENEDIMDSEEALLRNRYEESKWYRIDFILVKEEIIITFTDITDVVTYTQHLVKLSQYDELTNLYTKAAFNQLVEKTKVPYAILFLDVLRFKVVNNYFGKAAGDLLLIHIAEVITNLLGKNGFASRLSGDRYAILLYTDKVYVEQFSETLLEEISNYDLGFNILCNIGIYIDRPEEQMAASLKVDRAIMAQTAIKGNFTKRYNYYTDDMTTSLVNEQGVTASMVEALDSNQFVLYFQPQFSHVSKKITGAEVLVRWKHPHVGMIPPNNFIPIFEKNNFITHLDMYVFEKACIFLRKCMNQGIPVVPISTNFSRYDVIQPNFIENIEDIRLRYNIPVEKIRLEITESAVVEGSEFISSIVGQLQEYGYVVEMDDFGSGYSSLNVLKDINFDIIKLDMKFMSNEKSNYRGRTILASVVGMSAKLHMSIIAEGVETEDQADFLRDIGCEVIQGYLYSKPVPEDEYIEKLKENLS